MHSLNSIDTPIWAFTTDAAYPVQIADDHSRCSEKLILSEWGLCTVYRAQLVLNPEHFSIYSHIQFVKEKEKSIFFTVFVF